MNEGIPWIWVQKDALERSHGGWTERVGIVDGKIVGSFSFYLAPTIKHGMDPPLDAVITLVGKRGENPVIQRMLGDTAHLPDGYYVTDNVTVGDLRKTVETK